MKLIGVTGGIGMGKSASAEFLARRGVRVIDTDQLARTLVEPGQPALAEIVAAFGAEMIDEQGCLRRARLAQRVFGREDERQRLEAILHPRIRTAWIAEVARWRAEGAAVGAVIIPLLYETQAEAEFDLIVAVACLPATQRERLRQRGWDDTEIDRRLASQWPAAKKIDRCHRVVWTEPGLDVHAAQIDLILRSLSPGPL